MNQQRCLIQPQKNQAEGISPNDITKLYAVPQDVQLILKTSCYDCHSNNTIYPWYSNVQPFAWWLKKHIDDVGRLPLLNKLKFGH